MHTSHLKHFGLGQMRLVQVAPWPDKLVRRVRSDVGELPVEGVDSVDRISLCCPHRDRGQSLYR